jgi:hypothetical protein
MMRLFAFHNETNSGAYARARTLISQLTLKSQCPLLERIEVGGSLLCFSFHDETEHAFVLP